jgi:hypothetical protein
MKKTSEKNQDNQLQCSTIDLTPYRKIKKAKGYIQKLKELKIVLERCTEPMLPYCGDYGEIKKLYIDITNLSKEYDDLIGVYTNHIERIKRENGI